MSRDVLVVSAPDGARADLILHHGDAHDLVYWLPALGVTARNYDSFASELGRHGIGVAAHEWRGAGSSDRRAARGSDWAYRDLLADVHAGIAALRVRAPAARIWIGGHSLGAQLAALVLARDRSLRGVLIVASGIPHWRSFTWWQQPVLLGVFAWFRLLAAVCGYFPGRRTGFAGNEAKSVIRDWSISGLRGTYKHALPDGDLDAELAALTHPLFALHLQDDRFAPPSSFAALLARLPRTRQSRVHLVPKDFTSGRADHFSWLKDPAPVAAAIAAFVRSPS